jgi:hypothetical protein
MGSFCSRLGVGNFSTGVARHLGVRPAKVEQAVQRGTAIANENGYRLL